MMFARFTGLYPRPWMLALGAVVLEPKQRERAGEENHQEQEAKGERGSWAHAATLTVDSKVHRD